MEKIQEQASKNPRAKKVEPAVVLIKDARGGGKFYGLISVRTQDRGRKETLSSSSLR